MIESTYQKEVEIKALIDSFVCGTLPAEGLDAQGAFNSWPLFCGEVWPGRNIHSDTKADTQIQ